jgi:hypothetical protein
MNYLLVGFSGAMGALARYQLGREAMRAFA